MHGNKKVSAHEKKTASLTAAKRKRPRVMVTVDSNRLAAMRERRLSISEATDLGMAAMLANNPE